MAKFTIQLSEYLQEHMTEGHSINNLDDVLTTSKEVLFDGAPTQAIENVQSSEYRDAFILGFTSHFLFDEIGMETMPAWKLALAAKILETNGFIQSTFEKLDNQVWADYSVRKIDDTIKDTGTVDNEGQNTQGGTVTDERDLEGSNTRTRHATSADTGTITDDGEVRYNGSVSNDNERYYSATSGSPKIVRTSEEMDRPEDATKAYTELTKSGKIKQSQTQSGSVRDVAGESGSETTTERDGAGDKAYVERTPSGTRTTSQAHKGGMLQGYSDHATDTTQAVSQTPQSGITGGSLMGTTVTPTAYAGNKGSGSVATVDQSGKKYLTTAQQQWNNDRAHSTWNVPVDDVNGDVVETNESYDNFHDKQETHYNRVQEHEFTNRQRTNDRTYQNLTTDNVTDYDYQNSHPTDKQVQHFNRKNVDTTEYPNGFKEHQDGTTSYTNRSDERDNERRLNTQNAIDDSDVTATTDEGTITHIYDKTDGHDNTETRNLKRVQDREEKTFNFSYEMFLKAEPYLKKLWSLFDECFMLIIDDEYYG